MVKSDYIIWESTLIFPKTAKFSTKEYSDNYFITTTAIILPFLFLTDFIWMTLSHKGKWEVCLLELKVYNE